MVKNILIACEESQEICKAFRALGHNAFSCDIKEPSGGHPEWHIHHDVLPYINGNCTFQTMDGKEHTVSGTWDLLIAHPDCFVAGTKVITYDGIKNIEEIQEGDLVLTHKGRYMPVNKIITKLATNLVDLQVENSGHIICTDNHSFYTQQIRKKLQRVNGKRKRIRVPLGFEWKTVNAFNTIRNTSNDIIEKTYVSSICDNIEEIPEYNGITKGLNNYKDIRVNTLNLHDSALWYIIGRWLGDGSFYFKKENGIKRLRGIDIVCNRNESKELQQKIEAAGLKPCFMHKDTCDCFEIYGIELASFLMQFGQRAKNKEIPGFVMRLPQQLAEAFLNGYFDADGCYQSKFTSYTSISSNLAYGIKYMVNKYYNVGCSITKNDNSNRNIIMGRKCNVKDSYSGRFSKELHNQTHFIKYDNYILSPYKDIKIIENKQPTIVYNLSVEEDESYTANGIIVHNCTYLTVSGNRWFNVERYGQAAIERAKKREEAAAFFMKFIEADCPHIAVENPIGYMNSHYRKPNQIIEPYWFGHPVAKKTCLWLKNLPNLVPTDMVEPERIHSKGKTGGYSGNSWYVKDENGKILSWNDPRTAEARSKTFPGVAKAIAEQWGNKI